MPTYISDEQALQKAVSKAVQKGIEEKLPEIIYQATRKRYYTISETCEALNISRRSLQHLRSTKSIGYVKQGKKVYIRAEDIDAYLAANHIPPEDD